jgi:glyoxylase-like metal-dependent hydrolase (beta-lactamase superfamily II)
MERLALSNSAFEGDNNAYLFVGSEVALVDTGDWLASTREQLTAALADHGVGFADVDRIFLTHWHHDHTGLAGEIQAQSGAEVYAHAADAPLVAGDADAERALETTHEAAFEQWQMPDENRAVLREVLTGHDEVTTTTPDVTAIEGGERFTVADRELRAVHTPGHAAGHVTFELDGGALLSGDALLPEYTPNVGGADVRVERPLGKYLRTLQAIADEDYERAWPGHRDPIDDPTARAQTIVTHHEARAYRVLDALRRRGPCDVWTVSADLFGSLDGIHILHGPGECAAHLAHLERAGAVVADGVQYRLADGVADRVAGRENRWPLDGL